MATELATEATPSRRRALLGVGLGVLACAGCCAAPALIALGVGSVIATAVGVWVERVATVLLAFLILGSAVAWYRHHRAVAESACGTACSTDRSCGCGPAESKHACTLSPTDAPARLAKFTAVFGALVNARRTSDEITFELRKDVGVREAVDELVRLESVCCSFLQFDVIERDDRVIWTVRGPAGAAATLDLFGDLPRLVREREGLTDALARLDAQRGMRQVAS
jgi:hypothetical protein